MATATVAAEPLSTRAHQNWIISPFWDAVYFIATPLLSLAVVAVAYPLLGVPLLSFIFIVYTIAHHLPTFLRVYGDRDLWRRYRWQFVFGPVLPFAFAMLAVAYVIGHNMELERAMFLLFIPTVWDTWHFLMQHYGFVRIYDRPNAAPRRLASRMDLALCATWFTYIMVEAGGWLPNLLLVLTRDAGIPALYVFSAESYRVLSGVALGAAVAATVVYAGYLVWCRAQGYFISPAKLLLLAITFGTMYLTYVAMAHFVPGWSFWLGFIVIGFVHNTQYFAIVWKYCRSLTRKADPSRPPLFQKLFVRGGVAVILIYVAGALAYGFLLSGVKDMMAWMPWVWGVLFALGFTSLMMHYYFDGFIWKVRHRENQANLSMIQEAAGGEVQPEPIGSWWDRFRESESSYALKTGVRQVVYFGVPLAVLTLGAWWVHRTGRDDPAQPTSLILAVAQDAAQRADWSGAIRELHRARERLDEPRDRQLRLVALRPTASAYVGLAELTEVQAELRATLAILEDALRATQERAQTTEDAGSTPPQDLRRQLEIYREELTKASARKEDLRRAEIEKAVAAMQRALESPGAFDENPMKVDARGDRNRAYETLARWYTELGETEQAAQALAKAEM